MKTLKSSVILAAAISCAFFASCSKVESLVAQAEKYSTITLSIDQPVADNATKTQIGSRVGDVSPILWSSGDAIAVCELGNTNSALTYTLSGGADSKVGTFTKTGGGGPYSGEVCAYYPRNGLSGEVAVNDFRVTIPSEQKYVENSFDNGAMPMLACANTVGELHSMKPIMSVLKITLQGSCSVKSIKLKSSDFCLSGLATVNKSTGAVAWSSGEDNVTLTCDPVQDITVAKSFYFVLPPMNDTNFTFNVIITDSNNKTMNKNLEMNSGFEAGVIKEVPATLTVVTN